MKMTADQHHSLMERLARDDEGALEALVSSLGPQLLRFAARTLAAAAADAEDVVQEAFVRLWQARRRWQPTASVRSYLFTITTRLCLNRRRSLRRRPRHEPLPGPDEPLHPGDPSANPERLAFARQLRAAVAGELAVLPQNQRAALLLRHEGGLSYQEIAFALDTTPSAVESLLSRARARLRANLSEWMTEGTPSSRG